jgi:kynurenine formamidase
MRIMAFCLLMTVTAAPLHAASPTLDEIYTTLHAKHFVDLTHGFAPGIPHWKGFADERVITRYTYAQSGFLAQEFSHVGQWGTHVDPPAHFHQGLRTVDQIRPDEMLLRLVVLDIHARAARDADSVVTMDDVRGWEKRHGAIPQGAFVALRTDWSKRWPDNAAMMNADRRGTLHYPGWSKPVLRYLYEVRHITASGHETTDTDPGTSTTRDDYALESYVLGTNHYQVELLANLDQVPEAGALVMVTFPKPLNGSGFPARVIAILP